MAEARDANRDSGLKRQVPKCAWVDASIGVSDLNRLCLKAQLIQV